MDFQNLMTFLCSLLCTVALTHEVSSPGLPNESASLKTTTETVPITQSYKEYFWDKFGFLELFERKEEVIIPSQTSRQNSSASTPTTGESSTSASTTVNTFDNIANSSSNGIGITKNGSTTQEIKTLASTKSPNTQKKRRGHDAEDKLSSVPREIIIDEENGDEELTKRINRPQWVSRADRFKEDLVTKNKNKTELRLQSSDDLSANSTKGPKRAIRPTKPPGYIPPTDGPKKYRLLPTRKPKRRRSKKKKSHALHRKLHTDYKKVGDDTSDEDEVIPGHAKTDKNYCPTCAHDDMSEKGIKKLRTLMFFDTLMQKLRVDVVEMLGSSRRTPLLPESIIEQMMKDNSRRQHEEEDNFYAKDKEIILTGRDLGRDCISIHATGCYHFDLKGKVTSEVASARLWWYKTRDRHDISGQTFVVYELEITPDLHLRRRNLILRNETHTKEGWVSEDITHAVRRWVDKGRTEERLAIRCKTCVTRYYRSLYGAKHGYLPLLSIQFGERPIAHRRRRTVESCDPAVDCCKRPLEINFRTMGIRHIQYPPTMEIYYCYGFCDRVNQHSYNHTQLIQRLRFGSETITSTMSEQLKPCCVPTDLLDTYILTFDNDQGALVRSLLPNVLVNTCGCL